jgi:tRNA nucleotidyltransferase/poly(A) polymerase
MIIKKFDVFLESKNDLWDIIPNSIKEISILFKENGKELYLVGGAVRDFLNNENPKDFDLCTNATPDEILNIVGNKYKTTEQGKSFGVIVIYTKDQPMGIEVATFREDIYDDKLGITRNPEVKFSTIEKDVLRRDIPFNAMFYDLEKRKIIDLVGGVEDIKNKVTRFVGNANDRIIEDPLRILRLLRFSCRYDFNIDNDTKKSIIDNKDNLSIISKERIYDEFKKSWSQSKNFNNYLKYITEFDMWEQVFPGSKINTNLIESKDCVVVMANLFKNESTKGLEDRLVQDYKIPNSPESGKIATQMVFLINLLNLTIDEVPEMYKKKVQCSIKDTTILEWFNVNEISDFRVETLKYKPSVSSKELMNQGFSGRELGLRIKELEIENFKKLIN